MSVRLPGESAPEDADLAHLFQEHNAALVQLLRTRLRSDQEAWDVAQEAYVRMLQLDRLGTISYLRSYLFRTAFNIATDRLRSRSVRTTCHLDPMLDPRVDELSPDRVTMAKEALLAVSDAMKTLPPKARQAFVLYRFEGLDVVEIARRIGVSDRMVRYYIRQALVACNAAIEERPA